MRAAGILVFCLFSSILSTVTSLRCEECVALEEECGPFDTKVVECQENEDFCSTLVANTTLTNIPVSLIVKKCSTFQECVDGLFVTTIVDGRFEIVRANCCQTDVCNAEPLLLESYDELTPNGLRCPGCYALNEDYCKANEVVFCVGEEDQCLNLTSSIEAFGNYTEKSSYQGCTTPNTCSFPLGFSEIAGGKIQFNVTTLECRNASDFEPDLQWSLRRAEPSVQLLGNL